MEEKRVQKFIVMNRQKLPAVTLGEIRTKLLGLSDEQMDSVEYIDFKDPTTMLIISVLVGYFGVDRFMLGDTKNGVFKLLLTCCCGVGFIWWIIDMVKIKELTQDYNYDLLMDTLSYV